MITINSRWTVTPRINNILEENIEEHLYDIRVVKNFITRTQKTQHKIGKLVYIEIKKFFSLKDPIKKVKCKRLSVGKDT